MISIGSMVARIGMQLEEDLEPINLQLAGFQDLIDHGLALLKGCVDGEEAESPLQGHRGTNCPPVHRPKAPLSSDIGDVRG